MSAILKTLRQTKKTVVCVCVCFAAESRPKVVIKPHEKHETPP